MRNFIYCILILLFFINISSAKEYIYIVADSKINRLLFETKNYFYDKEFSIFKDIRGIVITFFIEDIKSEYSNFSYETLQKIDKIENFLAKNKNPAIIEVHTVNFPLENTLGLKNWEISTVVANKIEEVLLKKGRISHNQLKSVGYGEFLPSKNTPYNGGKNEGRVDIILLCNINGE